MVLGLLVLLDRPVPQDLKALLGITVLLDLKVQLGRLGQKALLEALDFLEVPEQLGLQEHPAQLELLEH